MNEVIQLLEDLRDRCEDSFFCSDELLAKILVRRINAIIALAKTKGG